MDGAPRDTQTAEHWNGVYRDREESAVSWFQSVPAPSLAMLDTLHVGPEHALVDVGAGASRLVDELVGLGFGDLTVLDVSDAGLARARDRLGPAAAGVDWVVADVLEWAPDRRFDVWHDRAVFHFLSAPADVERYRAVLRRAVRPGGLVVVGTFAEHGPTHCSGLPVTRYSADRLADTLDGGFELLTARGEDHHTPAGQVQPFTWAAFRVGP